MKKGYKKDRKGRGYIDSFGRIWDLTPPQLCPVCGQPDDYSDCNHNKLTDEEVEIMDGKNL